jgi:hypothetical protein
MPPGREEGVIEPRIGRLWRDGDGLLRMVILPDVLINVEDARGILAAMRELTGGPAAVVVVDLPRYANADPDTRRFFGGPEAVSALKAIAMIVHSPVMRVVVSFLVRLSGAPFPVQLFSEEASAVAWARDHVAR